MIIQPATTFCDPKEQDSLHFKVKYFEILTESKPVELKELMKTDLFNHWTFENDSCYISLAFSAKVGYSINNVLC